MQITKDKVASIHYTLTNSQGQVLDTSNGREPLSYIQGRNNLIIGLEKALEGKTTGDKIHVTIPPEEAYGTRAEELVQSIPREAFGDIKDIQPGMEFQMNTETGPLIIRVIEVNDSQVLVDGNHPLAGESLTFDVEVVDVRDASAEEIEHGHVH